jgi:hypothetical protein
MKNKIIPVLLFLFLYNLPSFSYWHKIYDASGGTPVSYGVVGDSANLYALINQWGDGMVLHSEDLGRTWDTIYSTVNKGYSTPHFRCPVSLTYAGEGYLYILYSSFLTNITGTGIKRIDTRTNKLVDSIKISDYSSSNRIFMLDSLNGVLRGGGVFINHSRWLENIFTGSSRM